MAPPAPATVDGVAAFYTDADPGPLQRISLIVRAGVADETLPTTGTLELLGLYALEIDPPPYASLGLSLSPHLLAIDVTAPPADLGPLLATVIARLRAPNPDQLRTMARLLADEPPQEASSVEFALLNRYGAQGPGLVAFPDAGLRAFDPGLALATARRAFVAGNAVLASDARLPADLRVELPPGPRWPAVDPTPWPPRYPAGYSHPSPHDMIITATVPHGEAARTAGRLLTARITRALRHELGLVYSPAPVSIPFVHHDLIGVHTDVPAPHLDAAIARAFEAIMDLAGHGPTPQELSEDARATLAQLTPESAERHLPWRQAHQHLAGETPSSLLDIRLETLAIDPSAVSNLVDGMIDTVMLGVPGGTHTSVAELEWEAGPRDARIAGRRFDFRRGVLVNESSASPSHVLSPQGVLYRGAAVGVAIPLREVAAMFAWPDGARQLIRPDGYQVVIEPSLIARGDDLIRALDGVVPSDRVIPRPPRDAGEVPAALSPVERLLLPERPPVALGSVVVLLAGISWFVNSGMPPQAGPALIALVIIVALANAARVTGGPPEPPGPPGQPERAAGPRLRHPTSRGGPDRPMDPRTEVS